MVASWFWTLHCNFWVRGFFFPHGNVSDSTIRNVNSMSAYCTIEFFFFLLNHKQATNLKFNLVKVKWSIEKKLRISCISFNRRVYFNFFFSTTRWLLSVYSTVLSVCNGCGLWKILSVFQYLTRYSNEIGHSVLSEGTHVESTRVQEVPVWTPRQVVVASWIL